MQTESITFRRLLDETRAGSSIAAWKLVERYGPHVRAVVRRRINPKMRSRFDSEDFAQDVWMSFFRICPRLREIDEPRQFVALLATMARNKVIDEVRRCPRTVTDKLAPPRAVELRHAQNPIASTNTPSQFAMARERWSKIMKGLSDTERAVVKLRLSGSTYREIADQIGIHEGSARRMINRLSLITFEQLGTIEQRGA